MRFDPMFQIGARVVEEEAGFPLEVMMMDKVYKINLQMTTYKEAQTSLNEMMDDFINHLENRFSESGNELVIIRG